MRRSNLEPWREPARLPRAVRRRRGGVLRKLVVLLFLLALAAAVAFAWFRRLGRAPRDGERAIAGLVGAVEVLFDERGVPHVFAASEADAARAVGYLHASERLTQMELGRRFARGQLAAVLGADQVELDERSRRLGFARAAEASVAALGDRSRLWLEAYAAGVNARLEEGERPPLLVLLGVEPAPWTVADSLCFASLMAYELAYPLEQEFQRLALHEQLGDEVLELFGWEELAPPAPELLAFLEPAAARAAAPTEPRTPAEPLLDVAPGGQSNSWAVGPSRSASGAPLLAGDPHLALGLPSRWYQVRVSSPEYDVQGFTLPGVPVAIVGQSRLRAWSVTTTGLDAEDNHVEDFDANAGTVRRGDARVAVERVVERVERRGTAPIAFESLWTEIGPLLPPDERRGLPWRSLAWTMHAPADPVAVFLALASEREIDGVWAAAESYVAPAQNLVLAQADGVIAFGVIGRRPVRARGDGRLPVPAWDGSYRWSGLAPASTNPRVVGPDDDVLATANADVRPEGYDEPFTADFAHPSRRDRILESLRTRADWDVGALAALQLDHRSPYALALVAAIGPGLDGAPDGPERALAGRALALLAAWDGRVEGAGAPVLFQFAVRELCEALAVRWREADGASALQGVPRAALRDALPRLLARETSRLARERDALIAAALAEAWQAAEARLGPDPAAWRLEELQTVTLEHPLSGVPLLGPRLSRGPFGRAGHDSTIDVAWSRWRGEDLEAGGAASLRFVADAADPDRSRAVLPGGQSGHPFSAQYDDQLDDWLAGRLLPMAFTREAAEAAAVSRLRLVPATP